MVRRFDLGRAPYVLYGVKYIDLVSLGAFVPRYFLLEAATHYSAPPARRFCRTP